MLLVVSMAASGAVAAGISLADGVGARRTGNADDVDGVGRDGELLLERWGEALELTDGAAAGLGDVDGTTVQGEEADGVGAGQQRGLDDVLGLERGRDIEGGEGAVAVEGIAGEAGAVELEIVGVDSDLWGDEYGVAGEVDERHEAGGVRAWERRRRRRHTSAAGPRGRRG